MFNISDDFWPGIAHVFLDMDGTLLDKHFDDYFWETFVPEIYAVENELDISWAKQILKKKYRAEEGTLAWTDLDFWSDQLNLDIPALKIQVEHLIDVHPYVIQFLEYCKSIEKKICLVTNAHSKTLEIKMNKTALAHHFDHIVCSLEVGTAKENPVFWPKLSKIIEYDPEKTLLADDTEKVLLSAAQAGLRHLIYVARPSSRQKVVSSRLFPSITYFKELIP